MDLDMDLAMACPSCGHGAFERSYIGEVRFGAFEYAYHRCLGCGSLYASPMPSPELLDEIYSPRYVNEHYSESSEATFSLDLEAEATQALRQAARYRPGGRLLDVGCGAGRFLRAAAEAGFAAEGHELTAGAAAGAAERSGRPVHTGPLAELCGAYDIVHMADVLEHSPRPSVLLSEAVGLLAKHGVLVLRGPLENQRNLFHSVTVLQREARTRIVGAAPVEMPPYHVNLFTLAGWRALVASAGLYALLEQVTEVHWPAPERFSPGPVWAVKALSLAITRSAIGRRLALGNRVWGLFAPASQAGMSREPRPADASPG